MKGHSIRCYGTDLSHHKKARREADAMNVNATTIYKDGLAFLIPRSEHYKNGKVKTRIYNLIRENTVSSLLKLEAYGVVTVRVGVGEAV